MTAGAMNAIVVPAACRKASRRPKPAAENAVHFLIRMVHKYPHEVTIYEGGPMTNLALAISLDPEFAATGAANWCSWAAA